MRNRPSRLWAALALAPLIIMTACGQSTEPGSATPDSADISSSDSSQPEETQSSDAEPTESEPEETTSSEPATQTAPADDACDATASWTVDEESTEIGVNDPIIGIAATADECADSVVITLADTASDPGYLVRYVEEVHAEGSGDVVPLAGDYKIVVIIDSPTYDADFNPTLPTDLDPENLVDVTGMTVLRQIASGGSFESSTTIGIGIEGAHAFTVSYSDHQLTIQIAHAVSDTEPDLDFNQGDPDAAGTLSAEACEAINVEMRDNTLLDDFLLNDRTDPITADEVADYFAPADAVRGSLPDDFVDSLDALRDYMDGLVGKDAATVITELEGPVYRDTVRPVFWAAMTYCPPLGG